MKQVTAPVISNSEVTPGTHLIWLESPQIASVAQPGQFVMVHCGEDTLLPRPFSIHQLDGNKIALLFAVVGKGTEWLSKRQAGNNVDTFGPLGNGFTLKPEAKNILLVAGGIGIAPLCFLTDEAIRQGKNVTILQGIPLSTFRFPRNLLPPHTKIDYVLEHSDGLVTDFITDYLGDNPVFACGPTGMYRTMAQMPELKGKPVQVSLEVTMGCGRGVCYGCTIKTKQGLKKVCQDGPVFNLDDILWDEDEAGYL